MPTYEYECDACGHRFDEFQSITANPLRKCPACGRLKLRRLIGTGGAVIFKGGGFYETDYRSEGYRKAEAADRKSTDSKPAAETTSGGSSGDAGAPGKTETSKAASGDASGKADAADSSARVGSSEDATSASKGGAAPTDRGASATGASAPKRTTSGKRHAREGRGVGNLKPAARSGSTKKSTRRSRG
ncbi:MAG: FmdB family zinc ribbon protein [Phycisphaerales bacterium]|jgi:putative FmdB family regulatory protein